MKLELIRYNHDIESTSGILSIDGDFKSHTLEDQRQVVKVTKETRIPEGTYQVKFREVESGLTKTYREKYDFFKWHLELQDVPGFKYVYIHVGNKESHTDGCILIADQAYNDPNNYASSIGSSATNFERVYKKVSAALKEGEPVHIQVKSIWENRG
ncbi:MAG: hypothetical protein HRU26_12195 [Psychroserpens sp.]|nr:hypothetical protein [Psychroserpens sp.]